MNKNTKNAFANFLQNEITSATSLTPGTFRKKLNLFLENELPEALVNSAFNEGSNDEKEYEKKSFLKGLWKKEIELWKTDFFNSHWDKGLSRTCMREVLEKKAELNPKFKQKLIDLAKAGIMIVEYSNEDLIWATGPDGRGTNLLGILLMELGNEYLKKNGGEIVIHNPEQAFKCLQHHNPKDLSHNNLDVKVAT